MTSYSNPHVPGLSPSAALALDAQRIDVRKQAARAADDRVLPGAIWLDPFELDHEHPVLAGDGKLVFFCVAGHEVSQFACALARLHGCEAFYVEGGFDALAREVGL